MIKGKRNCLLNDKFSGPFLLPYFVVRYGIFSHALHLVLQATGDKDIGLLAPEAMYIRLF